MNYDALKYIRNADINDLANIAIYIASQNPQLFEDARKIVSVETGTLLIEIDGRSFIISREGLSDLRSLKDVSHKINAIKALRADTNMGLKDAKDSIEYLAHHGYIPFELKGHCSFIANIIVTRR